MQKYKQTTECHKAKNIVRNNITKNNQGKIIDVINMCIYFIKHAANMTTEDLLSEGNNHLKTAECKAFKMGCTLS